MSFYNDGLGKPSLKLMHVGVITSYRTYDCYHLSISYLYKDAYREAGDLTWQFANGEHSSDDLNPTQPT